VGAALAVVLPGCGGGGPTSAGGSGGFNPGSPLPTLSGTAGGGGVTVAVAAGSPLAAVGGAALVQSSSGSFLVTRTAADAFSALTATCTHEMCTITGFANQRFICPCHGSSFDAAGNVITGPAVRSLRSFPTRFASDVLTITL
jgi:thiosulfate dehydrogenase [quinone] large subunit